MGARGEWLEVLLLLDSDDHLLKVVGGNVTFSTAACAVNGILSVYGGPRDLEGSRC